MPSPEPCGHGPDRASGSPSWIPSPALGEVRAGDDLAELLADGCSCARTAGCRQSRVGWPTATSWW